MGDNGHTPVDIVASQVFHTALHFLNLDMTPGRGGTKSGNKADGVVKMVLQVRLPSPEGAARLQERHTWSNLHMSLGCTW